jgi:hypothetical protein
MTNGISLFGIGRPQGTPLQTGGTCFWETSPQARCLHASKYGFDFLVHIVYDPLMKARNTATVYSTEHGRICPECGNPAASCLCRQKNTIPLGDGIVRIGRESKGRKGKGVTTVTGVPLVSRP